MPTAGHDDTTTRREFGNRLKPEAGCRVLDELALDATLRVPARDNGSRSPMKPIPPVVAEFLSGKRIAVAGVSRTGQSAGNAVLRKLRDNGYESIPVNPNATEIEGTACYPDLLSIPGDLDGVVIATHPRNAADVVRQAAARGVTRVWFHRSFGQGSVADDAVNEARRLNLTTIVGGCPLMYLKPDVAHRCMRAVLTWRRRIAA